MIEVKISKNVNEFIKVSFLIQGNDPNWVPPLLIDLKHKIDRKKSSFLNHNDAEFFIAYKDGKPVGRIVAIENKQHNGLYGSKDGFFGFFECVDDQEVANALFDKACEWLKSRGLTKVYGPANYSSNDDWGLLVEGFDTPPFVLMPHNPEYYKKLIENYGFTKAKDLYAWYYDATLPPSEKVMKLYNVILEKLTKEGFKIRNIDVKRINSEVDKIVEIYHDSWSDNWFFLPLTSEEKKDISEFLVNIVYPELVIIVEDKNGEPVAFSASVHNINEVLIKYRTKNLFLLGIQQLLSLAYRLYVKPYNKFNSGRLLLAGVKKKYRRLGVEVALYIRSHIFSQKLGYKYGELSWTLEDNNLINGEIKKMGAKLHKIYRIYSKDL